MTGLSTKTILRGMDKGWKPARLRMPLFVLQREVDLYTRAPITSGSFFIGGSVAHVDHRVEQQLVAIALQRATHWAVGVELVKHAAVAVNPKDLSNYALVGRSINCSKGAVFQTAMSNAGGATLDSLLPLAAYAHPGTQCFPWLRPIAVAIADAQDTVVEYFREHGPGSLVGPLSGTVADELDAILVALRLEDIIDGQTDVRQTRAATARKAAARGLAKVKAVPSVVSGVRVPASKCQVSLCEPHIDVEGCLFDAEAYEEAEAAKARSKLGVRGRGQVHVFQADLMERERQKAAFAFSARVQQRVAELRATRPQTRK